MDRAGETNRAPEQTGPTGSASSVEEDVANQEERARAAAFGRAVTLLAAVGFVSSVIEPPRVHTLAVPLTTAILAVVGVALWWTAHRAGRHLRLLLRINGLASAVAGLVLVYAMGVFSPIVALAVFGLAFYPNASDTRAIFIIAPGFIALYGLLGMLVTVGVIEDRGEWIVAAKENHLSMTLIVTGVMFAQFAVSRLNRRALQDAIIRLHEASRVARTREAQLDEEREQRVAALRQGDGYFSGAVFGDWSLGKIVGRGAMGEVYAATSKKDSSRAAVKILLAEHDREYLERFAREADIARITRGPHLVTVIESGQATNGPPYIVMELLEGEDLGAILRSQMSLPLSEVVAVVEQVARGLRILHEAGVIHRDLKPSNIFRSYGAPPVWKILDYGVSKIVGAETVTQGAIVGTPGYMSPEQAQGLEVDIRSDVFALGAIAYRALTGRRPFSGADTPQLLEQVIHGRPTRPRELLPSLPVAVETVLASALAKRPDERFATATELADALSAAAKGVAPVPAIGTKRPRPWRAEPGTLTLPRGG